MKTLTFSTTIDAPKDRVWRTMLEDESYHQWTAPFQEGSYAVTDWKPGSKALFLAPDGSGMVSRIAEHRPNEYLAIEHRGMVKGGVEDTTSDEVRQWAGARETYALRGNGAQSTLVVELDTTQEHEQFFQETWPKALAALKQLAER